MNDMDDSDLNVWWEYRKERDAENAPPSEPECEVCGQPESECVCADDPRFTFPGRLERMTDTADDLFI